VKHREKTLVPTSVENPATSAEARAPKLVRLFHLSPVFLWCSITYSLDHGICNVKQTIKDDLRKKKKTTKRNKNSYLRDQPSRIYIKPRAGDCKGVYGVARQANTTRVGISRFLTGSIEPVRLQLGISSFFGSLSSSGTGSRGSSHFASTLL